MKMNLRIASLLVIIAILGGASSALAQTKTTNKAQVSSEVKKASVKKSGKKIEKKAAGSAIIDKNLNKNPGDDQNGGGNESANGATVKNENLDFAVRRLSHINAGFPFGDYGSTLNLTKGLILSASTAAKNLRKSFVEQVQEDGGIYVDSSANYFPTSLNDLNALQTELERTLENLNTNDFEENGQRAKAIEMTEQALSRVKTFVANNVQKKPKAMLKNKAKKKP